MISYIDIWGKIVPKNPKIAYFAHLAKAIFCIFEPNFNYDIDKIFLGKINMIQISTDKIAMTNPNK